MQKVNNKNNWLRLFCIGPGSIFQVLASFVKQLVLSGVLVGGFSSTQLKLLSKMVIWGI